MVIYPESFSIKPNIEATVGFRNLFKTTAQSAINKNLTLMKGNYVFCSKNAEEKIMHISNTVSEDEYPKGAVKNLHKCAIVLENVKNMDIDCGNSNFIMDGKMTHIYFKGCENIRLRNLNIETALPNVHKLTVVKASTFYITFEIDSQSKYIEENGEFFWVGTDYKLGFTDNKNSAGWIPTAKKNNPFHLRKHGSHPLYGVAGIKQVSERVFNARFIVPKDFEEGQVFYIYPAMREEVGIFIENSKGIELVNVKQTFNYSHALVAQNSENITLDGIDFSPSANNEVDFCSFADFLQFSMCRGTVRVLNSNFDSAGGNVCRIHGINFKIVSSNKDKMTVKFPHPKTYGFDCLRDGDIIAFIDPKTLNVIGSTKILHATLRDEYFYDLVLTTYNPPIGVGGFIECVPANPKFEFIGNTLNRVASNGIICGTRGKVQIENNKFLNTGAKGILVENDVSKRYVSGNAEELLIRGNAFMNCEDSAVLIKPDTRRHGDYIHNNIQIENNLFVLNNIHALDVASCRNIKLKDNVYKGKALSGRWILSKNVENIIEDCPKQQEL
ncbi:MAG: right-handed parallel beta-helix repeat-containing protein [Clostridia bacterium]|nr:right-handed parallel beta-helix repeat-containing protein [Clostridia bacterium]